MLEQMRTPSLISTTPTFDLGLHVLEVLEDQSILVMDRETSKEVVQLDQEESYRLMIALQSVFTAESSV